MSDPTKLFDREYRARLQAFLQGQLRALWVDEPRVDPEDLERPDPVPGPAVGSVPVPRDEADQFRDEADQHRDEADQLA